MCLKMVHAPVLEGFGVMIPRRQGFLSGQGGIRRGFIKRRRTTRYMSCSVTKLHKPQPKPLPQVPDQVYCRQFMTWPVSMSR